MTGSFAALKATAKYEAKTYDKTLIRLPKGRLDEIRAHIEPAGESLNGFIGRAILETMERDCLRNRKKRLRIDARGGGGISLYPLKFSERPRRPPKAPEKRFPSLSSGRYLFRYIGIKRP